MVYRLPLMPYREEKLCWLHLLDRKSQTGNSFGVSVIILIYANLLTSHFLPLLDPKLKPQGDVGDHHICPVMDCLKLSFYSWPNEIGTVGKY